MKCADMADAFDDGYKRGFNAAIDKAVEVAKKTFTACSKNPTATPCNEMVAEELKKLKEVR